MSQEEQQESQKRERSEEADYSEEQSFKKAKVELDEKIEETEEQEEQQNGDAKSPLAKENDDQEEATKEEEKEVVEKKQPPSASEKRKIKKIEEEFGVNPLDWPMHGTEVFMGGIPREASETQIVQFCEEMGEVFQFVFSKDEKSNINKGFGYCTYRTKNQALAAVRELHEKELKDFPGKKIRISLSEESRYKLYISNISRTLNKENLQGILELDLIGIDAIDLLKDKQEEGKNRGFCFIEFYNSKCAEYAKRKLSDKQYRIEGQEIFVTWAEPKKSFDQQQVDKSKEVYVGNLPDDVNEKSLQAIFEEKYGPIVRVVIPKFPTDAGDSKKQFDYGFIHFQNSKDAKKALHDAESSVQLEFEGKTLLIRSTWKNYQQARGGYPAGGRGRGRGYQDDYYSHGRGGYDGGMGYGGGRGRYMEDDYGAGAAASAGYGSYGYQAAQPSFAFLPMGGFQMPFNYGYPGPRPRMGRYQGDHRYQDRGRGRAPRGNMDEGRYGRYGSY